ncbi:MAG: complex I subunit 1 family protein [Methanoregulaceae archaeon]|jgi:NADH-quinone oxidoreductase subunit H
MMDAFQLAVYILLFPGFLFLVLYAFFFKFLDRKITARMQNRVGPPLLQPFADFVKMLAKEVINPKGVDRQALDVAPLLALAAVMTAYLYVPIIGESPLAFQGDLVVVLYLLTLPTIILFIIGWLSRNVFATIGGVRAVTQMFIYEVPFFLALITPALMAGSWSISDIIAWQQQNTWFAVLQPIGFIVALIGLQAKLERVPFDIPEAETEIVAGPWTELTGRRLALMQLSMNITLVTGSALVAAVFLGGPMTPWTIAPDWLSASIGFLLFLAKTFAILLILISITVASGRIRIDQLNDIGWKYLASAAFIQMGIVIMMNYLWVGA